MCTEGSFSATEPPHDLEREAGRADSPTGEQSCVQPKVSRTAWLHTIGQWAPEADAAKPRRNPHGNGLPQACYVLPNLVLTATLPRFQKRHSAICT